MAKKILLILAIILVIISAGLFYVNKVLLPVQIKGLIIKSAEEQLHRKVTFNELYYHPIKGVVITSFSVASKEKPAEAFLSLKEASAQVMLWPLLKKQVIVSSIHLDSPVVKLVRYEPELWNFTDILKSATPKKTDEKPAFNLVISGITVTNGQIQVTDRAQGAEFTEKVEAINLHGSLALNASVRLNGSLALPATQGSLKVNALYSFPDKTFKSEIVTRNIFVTRYLRFSPPLPLAVRDLTIADADLTVSGSAKAITVTGNGTFPAIDIDPVVGAALKTALSLRNISVSIAQDGTFSFQGGLNATGLAAKSSDGKSGEGNLKASVTKLIAGKAGIEFAGSLEADSVQVVLDQAKSLRGTFRLSSVTFNLKDNRVAASGDLAAENVQMTLDQAKSLSGAFHLNASSFSLDKGRLSAAGSLEGKDLAIRLDNGLSIKGGLSVQGFSAAPADNALAVKGEIKLSQMSVSTVQGQTVSGDITISRTNVIADGTNITGQADLSLQGLQVVASNLNVGSDIDAPGTSFSFKNGVSELAARLVLKKIHAALQTFSVAAEESTTLAVNLKNDPSAKQPLAYSGSLDVKGLELSGLPTVNKASSLTGKIDFTTDQASTKDLSLEVLDTPIKVSGEVSSFTAPRLNLDINIDTVNLALLEKVVPDIVKEQELKIHGNAANLTAHIDGTVANIAQAKIRAKAELKDASVESGKLKQKIEQVSGSITYDPPSLSWKDLHIGYQGKAYVLNGHLQDFANPAVSGSVKTTDITADYQIKKQGEHISLERLTGSYFDSSVDVTGSIELAPAGDPTFAMKGEVKLALKDLPKVLPPEQVKQIEALKLTGILKIKADIKGKPTDWMHWTSNVLIDTPALSAMGYEINNLRINATQKDGSLDPLTVDGDFYEGVIHATSGLDLTKAGFPCKLTFKLDSTNLATLKAVTPLKDRRLEGLLTFTANISGNATDTKSLNGNGSLNIKEGYLFEMPGLSLLGAFLQTSAQIGDITSLKTVSASWQIENGRVTTDDLHIKGPTVDVLGQGWVGLDQNMDMTFKPSLSSSNIGGGAAAIIDATGAIGELTGVRLYGPINNLKKAPLALNPAKVIPNVLKNTADSLLKLFQ